jgi:hypothetical protein
LHLIAFQQGHTGDLRYVCACTSDQGGVTESIAIFNREHRAAILTHTHACFSGVRMASNLLRKRMGDGT